ncbi:hypothetical protein [Streptomyces acidicola]|uniref:hypothetical protein n=1 Tax=Streptomyces acidicola TaxID=2596892 RepID=UPI00341B3BCF
MPTYETTARFTADLDRLNPEQHRRFNQVVTKAFVADLRTGGSFRASLREAHEFAESRRTYTRNPSAVVRQGTDPRAGSCR